jgi:sugar phosphate isomerase/epimerase
VSATLSVPSYVMPGTYLDNVRFIVEHTDIRNVELLFFMYDEDTQALMKSEMPQVMALGSGLGFTVHMPDSIQEWHQEIIEATSDFASSYIIHPPRTEAELAGFVSLLDAWREHYGAPRFLLENTRLSCFEPAEAALLDSRFGPPLLCTDVGHLLAEGVDPVQWIAPRADRIRELHVHGFNGHANHVPFMENEQWITSMTPFVAGFDGIVEIELFSWAELEPAVSILRRKWSAV